MKRQLGHHVLRAVAADRDVGELDAQLEQPVGEPGAVAVRTRPVSTSVPVTTMPRARCIRRRAARPAGAAGVELRREGEADRVGAAARSSPRLPFTVSSTPVLAQVHPQAPAAEGARLVEDALEAGRRCPARCRRRRRSRRRGVDAQRHARAGRGWRLAARSRRRVAAASAVAVSWRVLARRPSSSLDQADHEQRADAPPRPPARAAARARCGGPAARGGSRPRRRAGRAAGAASISSRGS